MKAAVITGGTGGLGLALAGHFQRNGFRVFTCSRQDRACPGADVYRADLADRGTLDAFVRHIAASLQKIDVLVNNAGISPAARVLNFSQDDFEKTVAINFVSAVRLIEHLKPLLHGGSVVNIVSRVGLEGRIGLCAYAASKGLLTGYTSGMARELRGAGVRINCVNPGFMATAMASPKTVEVQQEASVLRRISTPAASAAFIYWVSQLQDVSGRLFDFDSRIYSSWKTW
jgi:NAD(P)-dependent dehydrogenase (short-subunit alcohol dehydrogenase family)